MTLIEHKRLAILVQRKIAQQFETRQAAASALGVSASHLRAMIRGASPFSQEILDFIGYTKETGYRRK